MNNTNNVAGATQYNDSLELQLIIFGFIILAAVVGAIVLFIGIKLDDRKRRRQWKYRG